MTDKYINNARFASGVNIVAGLWLILAPFMLNFSDNKAAMNNSITLGLIIAIAAIIREISPEKSVWASWINVILGIWLFISAFTIAMSVPAAWSNIITAIIVTAMAATSISAINAYRHWHNLR